MFTFYIVLGILTAALAAFSGIAKLRRDPRIVKSLHEVTKIPLSWLPVLAALEIAGALGLIIGIFWAPLGIAAAIGLVLYFVGAVVAHLRVGDYKGLTNPLVPLALSIATLVTRFLSL
ncbi:DoxX family protein [Tengunoibacter tsumagoiensis]|uniref:Membrane protein n=1 Tax=Tengunoibacter tsumagoiensis TaxID=2014871 RepID=A0A402AA91_9CHLR|nr:DoxX family protein [Tengunoibacter tsumagoiensis]GCE15956.1 membrane protein [Tengunoibacter tsumagoiensis]